MTHEEMQLVDDPKVSVQLLRERSLETPVLVFKNSPICPVSTMAEGNLRSWLAARGAAPLVVCVVDVISERGLARGLTAELGIRHESPQALLFKGGELCWHDSHGGLTEDTFAAAVGDD